MQADGRSLGTVRAAALWAAAIVCLPFVGAAARSCPVPAAGEAVIVAGSEPDHRVRLGDGRLVELAGLDTPTLRLPDLAGRSARLVPLGAPDRHQAIPADLVLDGAALADALVRAGSARVRPHAGEAACLTDLLAEEDAARRAGLGLWAEPRYAVRDASDPEGVGREAGRFTLIQGTVVHAATGRDRVFIDFGPLWRTDVTVTIRKRPARGLAAAGLDPAGLAGRTLRVRGVVQLQGGPLIEVEDLAAIEALQAEAGVRSASGGSQGGARP